jgi:hypothetical protein
MSALNNTAHQQRLVADQILDRITSDPTFHQQLLDNTTYALRSAGFAPALDAAEVVGYARPVARPCSHTCGPWWTCAPYSCTKWTSICETNTVLV